MSLLAQRRQDYGGFRPGSFPGGNGSDFGRSASTWLHRCAEKTGVMRVSGGGTLIVIRGVQVRGKSEQPADDAKHRKRDDSFPDSMCEVHSGCKGATSDAIDLIPGARHGASAVQIF